MSDRALFAVAPLVSIVVLIVVAAIRARHDRSLSTPPSPAAAPRAAGRLALPAIGFVGLLLGHVVMIAWPEQLLTWNRDMSRLITFELAHFVLGAAAIAGIGATIWRRVLWRTESGAGLADTAFLSVLFLALASGLAVAVGYRWAAAWSAVTVAPYTRSLLLLQPNVGPLDAMPYLVKLHVFSSFIVIALLAFTRFITALLNGLRRATSVVMRPFVSVGDRQRRHLQEWALRGRHLMWPEEED
jgi:nitrate reductase gamma subunit